MRAVLLVCLITGSASAAPTRVVAGQRLEVLDVEPAFDEGTFVAAARSPLAEVYRSKLVTTTLTGGERADLGADALPSKGLFVVRVRRDAAGKRYLYKPCDRGHHSRTLVTDTQVWMLGTEPLVVPIARKQQRGKLTTIELDTKGFSPMVATKLRLRSTGTAGIYESAANDDGFTELVATPAAAAKLDVVVRVCKKAKTSELDFSKR